MSGQGRDHLSLSLRHTAGIMQVYAKPAGLDRTGSVEARAREWEWIVCGVGAGVVLNAAHFCTACADAVRRQ